jgi:hypothetical protein
VARAWLLVYNPPRTLWRRLRAKRSGIFQAPGMSLMDNQVFWLHEKRLIFWNKEVAKGPLLLPK